MPSYWIVKIKAGGGGRVPTPVTKKIIIIIIKEEEKATNKRVASLSRSHLFGMSHGRGCHLLQTL